MSYDTIDAFEPTGIVAALRADTAAMTAPRHPRADWCWRHRPARRTVAIGAVLAGLIVIGCAAAALSFAAIAGLAVQCGVPPGLAWLLPIVVDAGVVVGTIVWLSRRLFPNADARKLAAGYTIALLIVSVAANIINHLLTAKRLVADMWVIGPVAAIAPATVFVVVHLAVAALRPGADANREEHPVPEVDGDTDPQANPDGDPAEDADTDEAVDTDVDTSTDTDADGYSAEVRADAAALGFTLAPAPAREPRQARRLRIARERKRVRRAMAKVVDRDPEDVLAGE